jgi:para-nitrobenzyl esterase
VANVDGALLPKTPLELIKEGKHNQVPFAIGSNSQEAALFLASTMVLTCQQYETNVQNMFGAATPQILAHYPCAAYPNPKAAEIDATTDLFFTCGARRAARAAAAHQSAPVFRYYFTHQTASILGTGAFHSAELPYVFDTFATVGSNPTPAEVTLAGEMEDLWGGHAANGMPGSAGGTIWPAYTMASEQTLILDTTLATMTGVKQAECDFWDQLFGF